MQACRQGKNYYQGLCRPPLLQQPPARQPQRQPEGGDGDAGQHREVEADLPGQLAEEQRLRSLLLAGAATTPAAPADGAYFEGLRERMRKAAKAAG